MVRRFGQLGSRGFSTLVRSCRPGQSGVRERAFGPLKYTLAVRAYQAMGFDLVGLDRTLYDDDATDETAVYLARRL